MFIGGLVVVMVELIGMGTGRGMIQVISKSLLSQKGRRLRGLSNECQPSLFNAVVCDSNIRTTQVTSRR